MGEQPKYAKNDSFGYTDPRQCTVHDPKHRSCYLDASNHDGFYEDGPIVVSTRLTGFTVYNHFYLHIHVLTRRAYVQYSQYVPHDTAKLVELQGGKEAFIQRLDYIFDNVCVSFKFDSLHLNVD